MALLRPGSPRSFAALAGAVLLLLAAGRAAAAQAAGEYEVKALFLYNFVKFVEWPPDAFAGERSPLAICVYGEDPFGLVLDEAVHGESLGERGLIVQRPARLDELRDCQILFVSRSERHRMPEVLSRVEGTPVLTVGDTDGFLRAGGIINLVLEETKVRFLINPEAAERSRLRISSKLLRLALPAGQGSP